MIYVITKSDHYYPMPGVRDWIAVAQGELLGRALFDAVCRESDVQQGMATAYLIRIDPTTAEHEEIACSDEVR